MELRKVRFCIALVLTFSLVPAAFAQTDGARVISDKVVKGFAHPESVAYDPSDKVLYVSQFGPKGDSTLKDGQGKISKVSLQGKVLEDRFLPGEGGVLNKPKGIWIEGDLLWVSDIDAVWLFNLKTRQGKKVDLPGRPIRQRHRGDQEQAVCERYRRGSDFHDRTRRLLQNKR